MARRDPEAELAVVRQERRDQVRELTELRAELDRAQSLIHDLEADVANGDNLVRWLLRDQNIAGLDLRVHPGSRHDLDMMKRLVIVMDGDDFVAQAGDMVASFAAPDPSPTATVWSGQEPGVQQLTTPPGILVHQVVVTDGSGARRVFLPAPERPDPTVVQHDIGAGV